MEVRHTRSECPYCGKEIEGVGVTFAIAVNDNIDNMEKHIQSHRIKGE